MSNIKINVNVSTGTKYEIEEGRILRGEREKIEQNLTKIIRLYDYLQIVYKND